MNRHERRKAKATNNHRDRQVKPEDWPKKLATEFDGTPEEEAAEDAVIKAIESLAREHKPEHFMFTLGVLFAQGLAVVPEARRDEALDEFLYRLAKDCGIEFGQKRNLSEEEVMQRRQYHAQILMEIGLAAIKQGE
jgi:hypothetical protein